MWTRKLTTLSNLYPTPSSLCWQRGLWSCSEGLQSIWETFHLQCPTSLTNSRSRLTCPVSFTVCLCTFSSSPWLIRGSRFCNPGDQLGESAPAHEPGPIHGQLVGSDKDPMHVGHQAPHTHLSRIYYVCHSSFSVFSLFTFFSTSHLDDAFVFDKDGNLDTFKDHLFTKDVLSVMSWILIHQPRYHTFPHHDADGLGTWTIVKSGDKFWVVLRSKNFETHASLADIYKDLKGYHLKTEDRPHPELHEETIQIKNVEAEGIRRHAIFARAGDIMLRLLPFSIDRAYLIHV